MIRVFFYCELNVWMVTVEIFKNQKHSSKNTHPSHVIYIGYLKVTVEEHLQMFSNVFGENITPKQHYLVHLLSQILKYGPLVRTWAVTRKP